MSRTWSSDSPNVQVGLDRVQQYMLFFLFQNKDSLVPQMGNVMAIGLTPSRTGIVIGPSRTGIVIGRLLNAQLRHMSGLGSECARCLEAIHNLYFGHRHAVGKLHNTVWFYKVRWSFPSHFPSLLNTLVMPVRILLSLSSITYNDPFSAINMGL